MLFTDCNFTLRDFRICIFRDIEKNSIGGISKKWTFPKYFRFLMCLLIEKKWKTSFPDWVLWLVKSVTWVNTFWSINLDNRFKKPELNQINETKKKKRDFQADCLLFLLLKKVKQLHSEVLKAVFCETNFTLVEVVLPYVCFQNSWLPFLVDNLFLYLLCFLLQCVIMK